MQQIRKSMRFKKFATMAVVVPCLCVISTLWTVQAANAPAVKSIDISSLRQEIERIAQHNEGNVGVSIKHLESGRSVSFNGDELFFMASTYKIPIAVQALKRVENGDLKLDQLIEIRNDEYMSWSLVAERLNHGPAALALATIIELTLVLSDNTATDVLVRSAGGADQVTAMVRDYDIDALTVSRTTKELILDYADYPPLTKRVREDGLSFYDAWAEMTPEDEKKSEVILEKRYSEPKFVRAFLSDPRDKASPNAMLSFIEKAWAGEMLNATHTQLLKDIMERCETGDARIKAKLPVGTVVMHKTGTLDGPMGVTNNAGVIELPGGRGRVAIVVYVRNGDKEIAFNEEIIADISQAAYNYFAFTSPAAM